MTQPVPMAELWRGGLRESQHLGHAVICDAKGQIVEAWGDAQAVIYPRSSCKMIQALPLVESGAADAAGLTDRHLALACASHKAAHIHTDLVGNWLAAIGRGEADLRCGPQWPDDIPARDELIRAGGTPCRIHNNCSGKHTGFLTLARHLGAPAAGYVDIEHPVQQQVLAAFEDVTGTAIAGYGVDGCSAPNFATPLAALATAMARFAAADEGSVRGRAMVRLRNAMMAHPELVSGEGFPCTEYMRALGGRGVVKTGAEAVYTAILPGPKLGIALKVVDGNDRGSQLAIAALLVRLGLLPADHPAVRRHLDAVQKSRAGEDAAILRAAPGFPA